MGRNLLSTTLLALALATNGEQTEICRAWNASDLSRQAEPDRVRVMLQLSQFKASHFVPGGNDTIATPRSLAGQKATDVVEERVIKEDVVEERVIKEEEQEEEEQDSVHVGKDAPLTQEGFEETSAQCCELAMDMFMRRLIADLEMTLCYEGGLNGFVPFLVCTEEYTFDEVVSQLKENSKSACPWVHFDENLCWAKPWPQICNQTNTSHYDPNAHRRRSCPKKSSTTTFSRATTGTLTTTASQSTSTARPDACLPNSVVLDFFKSNVTQNNLGGMGPKTGDAEELRYHDVGSYNGEVLDLVVRTKPGQTYRPNTNTNNGLNCGVQKEACATGGHYAQINLGAGVRNRKGERIDLVFTVESATTKKPVILPGFYMSFLDIDQNKGDSGNSKVREVLIVAGHSRAIYDKTTQDIAVEDSASQTIVRSMKLGHGCDNPDDPANLRVVSCQKTGGKLNSVDQKKRSIMFLFRNVASFYVTFETICNRCSRNDGRNFLFATRSSMVELCD